MAQFDFGFWNFVGTLTRTAAWAVSTTISSITYAISVGTSSIIKISTLNGSSEGTSLQLGQTSSLIYYDDATYQNFVRAANTSADMSLYTKSSGAASSVTCVLGSTTVLTQTGTSLGVASFKTLPGQLQAITRGTADNTLSYSDYVTGTTKGQANKAVTIYDTNGTTVLCSHTMDYSTGHTFVGNVTVPSLKIKDSGNDHVITLDTSSDEAADRNLTIPALGGNKTLACIDLAQTFTAQQIFEVGAAGASPLIVRQTGGSAGTDELQLMHDGTRAEADIKSGGLRVRVDEGEKVDFISHTYSTLNMIRVKVSDAPHIAVGYGGGVTVFAAATAPVTDLSAGQVALSTYGFQINSTTGLYWSNSSTNCYATYDTALERASNAVVKLNTASGWGSTISSPHYTYAQITANQPNFSLATVSFGVRVTSDASRDIQGIAAGNSGEMHRMFNVGSFNIVLKHNSGSATGKVILCHGSADITLAPNDQADLEYDSTTQAWRAR